LNNIFFTFPMIPPQAADRLILTHTQPLTTIETIPLTQCRGRILAQPITSQLDFPHWDNSAMDGYAVRFADVQTGPVTLTIVEAIPAGKAPTTTLQPGQAARILTGSMMPPGADTVVMQENTQRDGHQITILQAPKPQEFVRHQGTYYKAGNPLLATGTVLNAAEIAILAAAQVTQIPVLRQPKVAILSTGSELVEPDQPLRPGQIVDSNQYALAALVEQMGAIALPMGVVADDPDRLKAAMQIAIAEADVVISTGGVSVGDYDYVDRLLEELGATIHIRKVAIKPGKPLTFATQGETLYFGLPGNPASALVTFWRFVQPAIRKRSGLPHGWAPTYITAQTAQSLKGDRHRETYLWGQIHYNNGQPTFHIAPGSHLSGNLINLAGTTALAIIPIGTTEIAIDHPILTLTIA
jgi:molybdopterin molybdotransferase